MGCYNDLKSVAPHTLGKLCSDLLCQFGSDVRFVLKAQIPVIGLDTVTFVELLLDRYELVAGVATLQLMPPTYNSRSVFSSSFAYLRTSASVGSVYIHEAHRNLSDRRRNLTVRRLLRYYRCRFSRGKFRADRFPDNQSDRRCHRFDLHLQYSHSKSRSVSSCGNGKFIFKERK